MCCIICLVEMPRTRHEIYAEILSIAKEKTGITRIVYFCLLNFGYAKEILTELEDQGLIEIDREGKHAQFQTTSKGFEYLQHYNSFKRFIQ